MPAAKKTRQLPELEEKDLNRWKKPPREPAIDDVVAAVKGVSNHQLYMNCYLSKSTIQKLRRPDGTRKPQHMTLTGVLGAAGLEYVIRKRK